MHSLLIWWQFKDKFAVSSLEKLIMLDLCGMPNWGIKIIKTWWKRGWVIGSGGKLLESLNTSHCNILPAVCQPQLDCNKATLRCVFTSLCNNHHRIIQIYSMTQSLLKKTLQHFLWFTQECDPIYKCLPLPLPKIKTVVWCGGGQGISVGLRDGGKLQAGATLPPEYHISMTLLLF